MEQKSTGSCNSLPDVDQDRSFGVRLVQEPAPHYRQLVRPNKPTRVFHKVPYPEQHWARRLDPKFVVGTSHGFHVKLNPSDSRGYRLIVCLGDDEQILPETFNRPYTADERASMWLVAMLFQEMLLEYGIPIVQMIEAGNNAQSLVKFEAKPEEEVVVLGNEKEPSMLHVHLICRGVPAQEYFPGAPLGGPPAGEIFDLRGAGDAALGQQKTPWTEQARLALLDFFKEHGL
jgi:hypothetical protein